MGSQTKAGALALDFNPYAQRVLNDVMAPRDAFFRKDSIYALQAVVCFYAARSVREVSKAYPEAKRNAEALKTLTTVAIPGFVAFLKENGFDVPTDAAHLLTKTTVRGTETFLTKKDKTYRIFGEAKRDINKWHTPRWNTFCVNVGEKDEPPSGKQATDFIDDLYLHIFDVTEDFTRKKKASGTFKKMTPKEQAIVSRQVEADGGDPCMDEKERTGANGPESAAPSGATLTGDANGFAPTDATPSSEATKAKTISALASALPHATMKPGYFAPYALTWALFGPMSADIASCLNLKSKTVKKEKTSIAADGTHLESGDALQRWAAESNVKMGRAALREARKGKHGVGKENKNEAVEVKRKFVNLIEETGHDVRNVSANLKRLAAVSENRHAQQSEDRKIALLEKKIAFYKRQGRHDRVYDLEMQYEGLLDAAFAAKFTPVETPSDTSQASQTSDADASSSNGAESSCTDTFEID